MMEPTEIERHRGQLVPRAFPVFTAFLREPRGQKSVWIRIQLLIVMCRSYRCQERRPRWDIRAIRERVRLQRHAEASH